MFAKGRNLVRFKCNDILGGVQREREKEEEKVGEWEGHLEGAGRLSSARLHRAALIFQSPLVLKTQKPAVSQHKENVHLSSPLSQAPRLIYARFRLIKNEKTAFETHMSI